MATFKQFTADLSQSGVPSGQQATPAAFGGLQARALGDLGATAQNVSRELEAENDRRDLMAQYTEAAQARERAVKKLDELKATGEPVSEKMGEFLNEELVKLRENRLTKKGRAAADIAIANISADIGHAARTTDIGLAAEKAKEDAVQLIASNGAVLQKHPDMLPGILEQQRQFVEAMNLPPQVKRAMLRELNEEAGKNAVRGWISLDPYETEKMINEGKFDDVLKPDTRAALLGAAKTEQRAIETEKRLQRIEADRIKKEANERLMNDALLLAHDPDKPMQEKVSTIRQLAAQQKLEPAQTSLLLNYLEKIATEKRIVTDPGVGIDVVTRIANNALTESELINLALTKNISLNDFERWMERVKEGSTALKSVRGESLRNVPGLMNVPPQLSQLMPQFGKVFIELEGLTREREQEFRAAGKNPLDYYRDGDYEKDVRKLGQQAGIVPIPPELEIGTVMNGWKYIGGDRREQSSWAPATSTEVQSFEQKQKGHPNESANELMQAIERAAQRTSVTIPGRMIDSALDSLRTAAANYEQTLLREQKIAAGEPVPKVDEVVPDHLKAVVDFLNGLRSPTRVILPSDVERLRQLINESAERQQRAVFGDKGEE